MDKGIYFSNLSSELFLVW